MDPVGDAVDGVPREHVLGHFTVPHGHPVDEMGCAQGEIRHVEGLPAANPTESPGAPRPEHPARQVPGELIVAGLHRRVRGEHALGVDLLEALRQAGLVDLVATHLLFQQREHRQGRVSLVQVEAVDGCEAQGAEHLDPADPQNRLLAEAVAVVAPVERVGEAAVGLGVFGEVRIEEDDGDLAAGHPAHVVAPACHRHSAALDFHPDARQHRFEVVAGLPVDGVFHLLARGVEALAEIAAPVHEAHRDHGDPQVCGGADRVAREHAETPGVRRHLLLEGDLHREVRDDRAIGHS
jgi:hypothetical protein